MSVPLRITFPSDPYPSAPKRTSPREVRPAADLDETLPMGTLRRRPASEILPMKCLRCQGRVERSTAPVRLLRNGCNISWEALPAWVCTLCKSTYFEPQEVELVRQAVRTMDKLPAPKRA